MGLEPYLIPQPTSLNNLVKRINLSTNFTQDIGLSMGISVNIFYFWFCHSNPCCHYQSLFTLSSWLFIDLLFHIRCGYKNKLTKLVRAVSNKSYDCILKTSSLAIRLPFSESRDQGSLSEVSLLGQWDFPLGLITHLPIVHT